MPLRNTGWRRDPLGAPRKDSGKALSVVFLWRPSQAGKLGNTEESMDLLCQSPTLSVGSSFLHEGMGRLCLQDGEETIPGAPARTAQ